jgi:glycolate oxidase FAD binding subunit
LLKLFTLSFKNNPGTSKVVVTCILDLVLTKMTSAIASILQPSIQSKDELINLEDASALWQERIKSAIANENKANSPILAIRPHSLETLSTVIKQAHQQQWKVIPCGNGSKLSWGGLVKDSQLVVSTQNLNRIIEHAVGDLTVTVEAGVKLADLQQVLNETARFLPLDPIYPEEATLGGIVATAEAGSWRQRYGGVRDMLLGISFVRADGEIAKAGGRVVKNVAGYDLMKLFTGSYGTLGIISTLTFRVYPLPEASKTLVITGDSNNIAAIASTLRNSGLTLTAADLMSASLVEKLEQKKGIGLIVRFQSIYESVQQQTEQLQAAAQKLGLQVSGYQETNEINLWQRLREIIGFSDAQSAQNMPILCKIGIIPHAAVTFVDRAGGLGLINISSGLGKLRIESENALTHLKELRSQCEQHRGFLTVLEAPASVKQQIEPWGYTGNALEMMRKIKQNFDPKNILSPDRFVGGT